MVGGIVYAVNKFIDDRVNVTVQGTGCERNQFLAVDLERNAMSLNIKISDQIWWQNAYAYWTPKGGSVLMDEWRIPRIGLARPAPIEP